VDHQGDELFLVGRHGGTRVAQQLAIVVGPCPSCPLPLARLDQDSQLLFKGEPRALGRWCLGVLLVGVVGIGSYIHKNVLQVVVKEPLGAGARESSLLNVIPYALELVPPYVGFARRDLVGLAMNVDFGLARIVS
jgi:hypothetical protein